MAPHMHIRGGRGVATEVLIVLRGGVRVFVYDEKGKLVAVEEVGEGQGIAMVCGHGVEVLRDAVILEVKEGSYPGSEKDKVWI